MNEASRQVVIKLLEEGVDPNYPDTRATRDEANRQTVIKLLEMSTNPNYPPHR